MNPLNKALLALEAEFDDLAHAKKIDVELLMSNKTLDANFVLRHLAVFPFDEQFYFECTPEFINRLTPELRARFIGKGLNVRLNDDLYRQYREKLEFEYVWDMCNDVSTELLLSDLDVTNQYDTFFDTPTSIGEFIEECSDETRVTTPIFIKYQNKIADYVNNNKVRPIYPHVDIDLLIASPIHNQIRYDFMMMYGDYSEDEIKKLFKYRDNNHDFFVCLFLNRKIPMTVKKRLIGYQFEGAEDPWYKNIDNMTICPYISQNDMYEWPEVASYFMTLVEDEFMPLVSLRFSKLPKFKALMGEALQYCAFTDIYKLTAARPRGVKAELTWPVPGADYVDKFCEMIKTDKSYQLGYTNHMAGREHVIDIYLNTFTRDTTFIRYHQSQKEFIIGRLKLRMSVLKCAKISPQLTALIWRATTALLTDWDAARVGRQYDAL